MANYLAGDYRDVIDLKLSLWVCHVMYVVFQMNSIVILVVLLLLSLKKHLALKHT